MDDLYADYDPESISGRMDKLFNTGSVPRINLPLPDDLQTSFPPGLPKYDPSCMPYPTFHEFSLKPGYIPPLSYYALRALQPHYAAISPLEELLSSQVSVETKRVNIVDSLLPHAKQNMDYVDPPTWAILIQLFDGLPERCFRYTLALNDPHLSTLSAIPSTPNFSVVTFLDLSGCNELLDGNISFLKGLTSLCVFDASCTRLTDQGVKNFKSTLFLQEPGPAYLRSWSLRDCEGITSKALGSLMAFPLLCVLDLRDTSIQPSQLKAAFWPTNTRLPVLENMEYFAPHPQYRIPELLQQLEKSSFLHSKTDPKPKAPYVIHVDRVRPKSYGYNRSRGSTGVSRIANNVYHVSDVYVQPSDREERGRFWHERPRYYSEDYPDGDYYSVCEYDGVGDDWSLEDERSSDSEGLETMNEDNSDDELASTLSSENSFDSTESPDIASSTYQGHMPPAPVSAHTLRSPSPPMPEPFSDKVLSEWPIVLQDNLDDLSQGNGHVGESRGQESTSNASGSPRSTAGRRITVGTLEVPDGDSSNTSLADVFERESRNAERAIPGFFNPRAQAGLAPPKRKRGLWSSSESSKGYDSEEEHKKQRTSLSVLGDVELLLLRRPPPWFTVQKLIDAKQKTKASTGLRPQNQAGTDKPELCSAQLSKKRKNGLDGAKTAWNLIRNSSSKKSASSSSSTAHPLATNESQASPSATLPQPSQKEDKRARRTTIGRPPKAPGTAVWKTK
ncbi:hypothetical protein FRC07_005646 [Ceratobasidium sp. 392]|nr:hypothetical protein FRC07_005646 [Ceratobasidium sp. 392]